MVGRTLARIGLAAYAVAGAFLGLLATGSYEADEDNEITGTLLVIGAIAIALLVALSLNARFSRPALLAAAGVAAAMLVVTLTVPG